MKIANTIVSMRVLVVLKAFVLGLFLYLGYQFGKESFFDLYLWLPPEQDFVIFWFFTLNSLYWCAAFGWSAFLAAFAFRLHGGEDWIKYSEIGIPRGIQQFALHFLGGIIGCAILFLFLRPEAISSFTGWEKLLLLVFAFLGVTGYIPFTLVIKNWFPGK